MVVGDLAVAVDVVVLGAGPGGYVAAIRAAQLGKDVVIVEPKYIGGVCLNEGCIPSKSLLTAADRVWRVQNSAEMGIIAKDISIDLPTMQSWTDGVVGKLVKGVKQLLKGNGVEIVSGAGWFMAENEVRIEGEYGAKRYAFEQCVIATGGTPAPLPNLPFDGKRVLSAREAYRLQSLPTDVTVIGSDYISAEVATFFGKLGIPVTILLPAGVKTILPNFDAGVGRHLKSQLKKLGVTIKANVDDPVQKSAKASLVVISNGIVPRTADLHLHTAKVQLNDAGFIEVDDRMRSSNPNIFAVGDVTGISNMAAQAMKQAKVAAETMAGNAAQYAPQAVPKVAWTEPEVASVGLTAKEAESAGYVVTHGQFPMGANGRALMLNGGVGFVSTVAEKDSGVLLGVTMLGAGAADLIAEAALALEMGVTLTDLAETIHVHPGMSEPVQESAEDALGSVIHILHKK